MQEIHSLSLIIFDVVDGLEKNDLGTCGSGTYLKQLNTSQSLPERGAHKLLKLMPVSLTTLVHANTCSLNHLFGLFRCDFSRIRDDLPLQFGSPLALL